MRRFNNLEAALRYLRPSGATEATEIPDAPANSQLRLYQDYKAGKRIIRYAREAGSNPGDMKAVALKCFALPSSDTTKFLAEISNRSLTNIAAAGVTPAVLNIDTTPDSTADLEKVIGFSPAKAIVKNVTGTTGGPKTSKITGDSYKTKPSDSYTFPFGSGGAGAASYSEVKGDIAAAVAGATGNKGVSFKPEIYR
ncbi:MAG: hypothetical protein HC836_34525 [Richelia sp. RM2_1_2]|nr:hypothetical protein [Richelia sp. RM2_1_2]